MKVSYVLLFLLKTRTLKKFTVSQPNNYTDKNILPQRSRLKQKSFTLGITYLQLKAHMFQIFIYLRLTSFSFKKGWGTRNRTKIHRSKVWCAADCTMPQYSMISPSILTQIFFLNQIFQKITLVNAFDMNGIHEPIFKTVTGLIGTISPVYIHEGSSAT